MKNNKIRERERMFNIEEFLNLDNYVTDEREQRRRHTTKEKVTAEFFTPYSIVSRMCDKINDETWSDPSKTFVEPSFGNGQFILMILYKRLQHNIDWRTALKTTYGVELMTDNVAETKARVCGMLNEICEDFDEKEARKVMDKNFVCHDFFTWDFENWREMTEEEIKQSKKKK